MADQQAVTYTGPQTPVNLEQPNLQTPVNMVPPGSKIRYPKLEGLLANSMEQAKFKLGGGSGLKVLDQSNNWIRQQMSSVDADAFRKTFEPPSPPPVDEEALERERQEEADRQFEVAKKKAEEEFRRNEEERLKEEKAEQRRLKLAAKEAELQAKYEKLKCTPIAQLGTRASDRLAEAGRALRVPGVKLDLNACLPNASIQQTMPPPAQLTFQTFPKLQKPTFKVVQEFNGGILGHRKAESPQQNAAEDLAVEQETQQPTAETENNEQQEEVVEAAPVQEEAEAAVPEEQAVDKEVVIEQEEDVVTSPLKEEAAVVAPVA